MGFEQTGHSWKCHRHLPLRCRAAPGRSAPLLGRRRGLGLRTGQGHRWKVAVEQQKPPKLPGEVDFTHEKWGISEGTWISDCDLTNKKRRISPWERRIWSSNHWKFTQKQDFTINHKDLTVIHWSPLQLVRSLQDASLKFPCVSASGKEWKFNQHAGVGM